MTHASGDIDMINLVDYKKLLKQNSDDSELGEENTELAQNRTCAQIFVFVQPTLNKTSKLASNPLSHTHLNLTLEIKMPANFYTLLGLLEATLSNRTESLQHSTLINSSISVVPALKETNPFDQIFSNTEIVENDEALVGDTSLNDESKLRLFKKSLLEKWLNFANYEIVYGSVGASNSLKYVEWSSSALAKISHRKKTVNSLSLIEKCTLMGLDTNFRRNLTADAQKYGVYAQIRCIVAENTNYSSGRQSFRSMQHTWVIKIWQC